MERYICVHGHFYQPPRENPWLESVELQDSAFPYHDWNRRISQECYIANRASRILDGDGQISAIVNNYSQISFDFGPTLLSWMEENIPHTYSSILEADRESRTRFGGHGSALAQAYNHMILPLANARDKYTQILWGIRDFERRFGRFPEGMWLPETAVDSSTLEILAELGIRFTVLAPHQAKQATPLSPPVPAAPAPSPDAVPAPSPATGGIDPSMSYVLKLASGRAINLFFYDGPVSRAVAFEKLLISGETFAARLMSAFSDTRAHAQLVHIATDGETYGHHHPHGDMALAYAIHHIQSKQLARITNYGEFLSMFPPTHEAQIVENSSWSCAHGIERWRSDCGCNVGAFPGWRQNWRGPLRDALDWLRDKLAPLFEEHAGRLLKDPWAARNDYISVILNRSREQVDSFIDAHALRPLQEHEKISVIKLMELQRHAMLMYTSCGWFFDELSGIETVQDIQYAGRALQLAGELFDTPLEEEFLNRLEIAKCNVAEHRDGRLVYEKFVRPARVDLEKAGAHYVVSSLFESYADREKIYCYSMERRHEKRLESGKTKLLMGKVRVTSDITFESAYLNYAVLYLGGHHLTGSVRPADPSSAEMPMAREMSQAFAKSDFPSIIRLMERHFGPSSYSLKSLFKDEQRKILDEILESTLNDIESVYRQLYENHAPLARFLADLNIPLPKAIQTAADFVISSSLRREIQKDPLDLDRVNLLLDDARLNRVALEASGLAFALRQRIERMAENILVRSRDPAAIRAEDVNEIRTLRGLVDLCRQMPFDVYLWKIQNVYYDSLRNLHPKVRELAGSNGSDTARWAGLFLELGEKLKIKP